MLREMYNKVQHIFKSRMKYKISLWMENPVQSSFSNIQNTIEVIVRFFDFLFFSDDFFYFR